MRVQLAPEHTDGVIADLADRQHGAVAWWQLREAGVTRGQVDARLVSGHLHHLHRGVYAVGHRVLTPAGRKMAAVLALGPGAVLSRRSAAEHRCLLPATTGVIHVTVPGRGARARRAGIRVHRDVVESTIYDGIPTTTVAQTLVDLAASETPRVLTRAIEGAEYQRVFDLHEVERLMHPGAPGVVALRAALAAWRDVPTDSELERRFLELCDEHGLPRPIVNEPMGDRRPDFRWPDAMLIVETDGGRHATRAALERDRRRDLEHGLAGYRTLRFTWRQVTQDGATVADLVRRTIAERLVRL